jgi:hypothetical protein
MQAISIYPLPITNDTYMLCVLGWGSMTARHASASRGRVVGFVKARRKRVTATTSKASFNAAFHSKCSGNTPVAAAARMRRIAVKNVMQALARWTPCLQWHKTGRLWVSASTTRLVTRTTETICGNKPATTLRTPHALDLGIVPTTERTKLKWGPMISTKKGNAPESNETHPVASQGNASPCG